jgi:hypothetical protein
MAPGVPMLNRRQAVLGALLLVATLRLAPPAPTAPPDRLSDEQFWSLISETSEPGGTFRSDNLLSNELQMQHVIPELLHTLPGGGAYVGVGPEQNFTYIAAVRPSIAFIVDIRRGNLHLHLLYKALFELSPDRAGFVSRLFSKLAPAGPGEAATAADLFSGIWHVETDDVLYRQNVAAVRAHLIRTRGLPLSDEDLRGVEAVYHAFYWHGPIIRYSSTMGGGGDHFPTYAQLMTATDRGGVARGFLASEEAYRFVRGLHVRNLIVPVVGDFAGPKALRAVGRYLKRRHTPVAMFYLSNVEQYLGREGRWPLFCANAAELPLEPHSTFVRAVRDRGYYTYGTGLASMLGNMAAETRDCSP